MLIPEVYMGHGVAITIKRKLKETRLMNDTIGHASKRRLHGGRHVKQTTTVTVVGGNITNLLIRQH